MGPVSFEIESYGQSETAQTSAKAQQDPTILLKYLDQFTNISDWITREEEFRDELLANQSEIEKATILVARIPEFKKLLAHAETQLKALEAAHASEVVSLERKIAEERTIRETIEKRLADLKNEVSSSSTSTY